MDGLKRRWDELRGLNLLLSFAFGPLKAGICGDPKFTKKVQDFLEGNYDNIKEIKKEIPEKLKTAWPNLSRIAKEKKIAPLSTKAVLDYIFHEHNLFAKPLCKVKVDIVKKIDDEKKVITTRRKKEIRFLNRINIKNGDSVAFHRGWLITKINALSK